MAEQNAPTCFLSIVVPMFNEAEVIDTFFESILAVLEDMGDSFEIICVDDGSRDQTFDRLSSICAADERVKVLRLSRNFGKETALTAGLDHAAGRVVVPIDADLQDPPELISDMIAKWREGYDVILPRRVDRSSDSVIKRVGAAAYYRLLGWLSAVDIPANVGDFRLMDQQVVEALALLPERARFMKGIFAWLGFRHAFIDFQRKPRAAGTSKLKFRPLWNLALEGIVSFSHLPLKIASFFGFLSASLALVYGVFILVRTLAYGIDVPGYASLIVVVLFMNGLTLLGLGVIGEYLSRVFLEVKGRPLYIVQETVGELPPLAPRHETRNVNTGRSASDRS